jgi:hypothetical protein
MRSFASVMLMKKTTVDLNDFFQPAKYQIRSARQALDMKPISISQSMDKSSDGHLRGGVLRTDTAHYFASALGR